MNEHNNQKLFDGFISRIKYENIKKLWLEDTHFREKFFNYVYQDIYEIDQLNILEFGVHAGFSTSLFLDVCKLNNGKLYSVDVKDYSKSFSDSNWTFIKSRDDNFDYIERLLPDKIDVILIDTLHKANHVEKILYNYYPKLKKDGLIIVDDVSWLYYVKNAERDNFFIEINNKETFFKLIDIYNSNKENINLEFNFAHSGVSKIKKKNNLILNNANKIKSRTFTLMNLIKKILRK